MLLHLRPATHTQLLVPCAPRYVVARTAASTSEFSAARKQLAGELAGVQASSLRRAFRLISRRRQGHPHRVADRADLQSVFEELNRYRGIKYITDEKAKILHAMLDRWQGGRWSCSLR